MLHSTQESFPTFQSEQAVNDDDDDIFSKSWMGVSHCIKDTNNSQLICALPPLFYKSIISSLVQRTMMFCSVPQTYTHTHNVIDKTFAPSRFQ